MVTVNQSTAANYIAQGDQLGNCNPFTGRTSAPGAEPQASGEETLLRVYPNPSTGAFTVALTGIESGADITVTDVQGRLVAQKRIEARGALSASFELDGISRGLYLISVKDGERLYRAKLVLQ